MEAPDPACHEDGNDGEPVFAHELAQLENARERRFGLFRILAVGEPIVAAGEPGILVDDAAQPIAKLVVGAFPKRAEGACRGNDGVVVDTIAGADFGDLVGHAGAAGDAIDEPARAFEHAMEDALCRRHLPEHIHVDAALAVGALMGDARLMDAAGNRVGDELLMALAPRAAMVDLRDALALRVVAVGLDAGESADASGSSPGTGAFAVGDGNALAALDEREHLAAGNHQRFQRNHVPTSLPRPDPAGTPLCIGCPADNQIRLSSAAGRSRSGQSLNTASTPQAKSSRARASRLTV